MDRDDEKRPGLRERKKADVRKTILECAERLFRQDGYVATSMADIANAANISRKTLFNYVTSKESIVLGMIDAFIGDHMPDWLEGDTPIHHDARDVFTPDVGERLDEIAKHRWLLTLAANHTNFFNASRTQYVADALDANVVARQRRIAAVQAEGHIRADVPALEISRYYEALRDLVVHHWLMDEATTPEDLHRMFANAMRVLQQGLEVPKQG